MHIAITLLYIIIWLVHVKILPIYIYIYLLALITLLTKHIGSALTDVYIASCFSSYSHFISFSSLLDTILLQNDLNSFVNKLNFDVFIKNAIRLGLFGSYGNIQLYNLKEYQHR